LGVCSTILLRVTPPGQSSFSIEEAAEGSGKRTPLCLPPGGGVALSSPHGKSTHGAAARSRRRDPSSCERSAGVAEDVVEGALLGDLRDVERRVEMRRVQIQFRAVPPCLDSSR